MVTMVTISRNLVEILIKNSAFCLNQTCPAQCIDCSLMRVLMSLGHKNLILLLGMMLKPLSMHILIQSFKILVS